MKEVKEKIVREIEVTKYVAADGTEFTDKDQCVKYEQSAEGVINGRYMPLVVHTTDEGILVKGDENHRVDLLELQSIEDVDKVLMMASHVGIHSTTYDQIVASAKRALLNKERLTIVWNCDETYIWTLGTLQEMIERLEQFKTC